jgi:hypothetical protein
MAKRLIFLLVPTILLVACASGSPATPGQATGPVAPHDQPTSTPASPGTPSAAGSPCLAKPSQVAPAKGGTPISGAAGKLSVRLQRLSDPALAQSSLEAQASAVSLPASGPGSLLRNEAGDLLVYVGVSDTTEPAAEQLAKAGAAVVDVAEAYCTITAYVSPSNLLSLAELPLVISMKEALSP